MATNTNYQDGALHLERCPHCRVANPLLNAIQGFITSDSGGRLKRGWRVYSCSKCGGAILGAAHVEISQNIVEIYPVPERLLEGMPAKAEAFLSQAIECLHAPSGAIMLCASCVDAMLKDKNLKDGSLYKRIEKARDDGIITKEMALWAHEVRLDANDERHADESGDLPTENDARRCIDFTKALGMFLFVLPKLVQRGLEESQTKP